MNKYNNSHCIDMTAKQAIEEIEHKKKYRDVDKKANELLGTLIRMIGLAGFHLEGRIEITHRRTGRKYRNEDRRKENK